MISDLRHRITLQKASGGRTASGGRETAWNDVATVSAAIKPASSFERAQRAGLNLKTTHKITIRYRDDVDAGMRFKFRDKVFEIDGLLNRDEENRWLDLTAYELGGTG